MLSEAWLRSGWPAKVDAIGDARAVFVAGGEGSVTGRFDPTNCQC